MAELWDAYYADGSRAGFDLERGKHGSIPAGIYHLVCEVLVRHRDGSILVMQRDLDKEGWPGFWEATAGGSALKGEDALQCAWREMTEETGVSSGDMKELFTCVSDTQHSIYHGFLCMTDCDKASVRLQEGETINYRWLAPKAFWAFMQSGKLVRSQQERFSAYWKEI